MASGVPLTPSTLSNSQGNDLQRVPNPRFEVNERRLRPIYDFMENHNYRKALTEIERLLKKQSNFTACKSLKCLVLLKLERHNDAEELAKELQALALSPKANSAPPGDASNMDENALTFLSQYYKDLRQYDQVVRLYEAATQREPQSEELLCSLFMAHVRTKDYRNQLFTAQKLYKLTRKTPYYNWAVISVLLQIDENAGQLKQTLYVPMAIKMLEKEFFDEQNASMRGNAGEMECLLYLHALELREDFSKALSFLSKNLDALTKSPSNESMLPEYFSHEKQLIYNFKIHQLETCYRLAKEFLRQDQFLWNWFEVLFDTYFKFDEKMLNDLFDDLDEFVCDSTNQNRNVHLARIEFGLRWRLFRLKNPTFELPKRAEKYFSDWFLDEIKFYVETFGTKTAVLLVFDVYRAFEHLSVDERSRLHRFFVEKFDEENLCELINRFSCARLCADVHRQWLIDDNLKSIRRLIELAEKSTTSTEQSTELFLLAAMNFEQLNRSSIDLFHLLDRIYLRDPSNFDTKLYLYKLATHFNCLSMMKDLFERLEIKNIQYYSLGYLLTDHYLRVHSNYQQARGFLRYLTNLLQVYTEDSWSQIMFCYKYGNFLRINEIRTFSDCYLSSSLVYFQSLVGSIVLDLIQNGNRYQSIVNLLKSSDSQLIFENKLKLNFSLRAMFYKNEENESLKLQDTRDFDIWPKIDFRRLQFDSIETMNDEQTTSLNYADRILSESAGPTSYQSPSYKDSFLQNHQTIDFQQRSVLTFLRLSILNLLHSLYVQSASTNIVQMPDEQVFQALSIIINDFHRSVQLLKPVNTITPCEIRTILELELLKTIPMFVGIVLDGMTINNNTNNASIEPNILSSTNSTVHFDRIDQQMIAIIEHLERTYQLIRQKIETTSFFQRSKENLQSTQSKLEFLMDFAGEQSVLEIYSIYTEFTSYIYSFHVAIRSILANLFNKTDLLMEIQGNPSTRRTTSKKNKKKNVEQQASESSTLGDNEQLKNLWNQIEKIEHILNSQWNDVITTIRHYEHFLSQTNEIKNEECERIEKELDTNSETASSNNFKTKAKSDEYNNRSQSSPFNLEPNQNVNAFTDSFEFGRTLMRASTTRALAVGYLESLIQIRVALTNKQKSIQSGQTTV